MKQTARFRLFRLLMTFGVLLVLFISGWYRLKIDTDIIDYLPRKDPAINDALEMFQNHPIQDRLVIDVGLPAVDLERLEGCAEIVEKRLAASGLFKQVGLQDFQHLIPELILQVADRLPLMFSADELTEEIAPLLSPAAIRQRMAAIRAGLMNLEGIGQAGLIEKDPLAFRNVVMAKLADLAPSRNARLYKGRLISSDRRHLLIIARPNFSGTDTYYARKLTELIDQIADEINRSNSRKNAPVSLTPVGAYRAALDNERIVKRDVATVLLLTTLGIALLLLFAFPRPVIGLLSLLPAIAGTAGAFFIFSLVYESISIMVLGFGGAIISITVDHGIAYLLFLDRPRQTYGKEASREVWAVGLLAVLTTVGAFGALCFSGFPIFEQLGLFAALGILLSFLFVHMIFPLIFPVMPPGPDRRLPLQAIADRLARTGKIGALTALVFMHVLLFWAKPVFNADLTSMNTVSTETLAAEKKVADVWGEVLNKVHLMVRGDNIEELQRKGDELLKRLAAEKRAGNLISGFVPSMIFPGERQSRQNLDDWRAFWTSERKSELRHTMAAAALKAGFTGEAFAPFFRLLDADGIPTSGGRIPEKYYHLMGINRSADGRGWIQVSVLTTGASYDPEGFYAAHRSLGNIFEPALFSQRLGRLLFATFFRMIAIIGISVAVLLFIFFLDLKLTIVTLIPVAFAFVSTLGTLNLIGHPLDVAGLMLAIIIIGMGIDYAIFYVRSYQRYEKQSETACGLFRMAVFMASASTLIGFGALCVAKHSILKSAGLTAVFGIGYSLIGAMVVLPPILTRLFQPSPGPIKHYETPAGFVVSRYRRLEAYHRLFARFKMRLDPMFGELPKLLPAGHTVRSVLDIGCGYGVPACWLLWQYPGAVIFGFDSDPERVRVAARALGDSGSVCVARAPDLPAVSTPPDLALMLDISHFLDEAELGLTLRRVYDVLDGGGDFIVRATLPPDSDPSWAWRIEALKVKIAGRQSYYRTVDEIVAGLEQAGFDEIRTSPSGNRGELAWFIAHKAGSAGPL